MSDLKGKFAVVTGAGKGIGAAIAARFLREQAAGVAIWDYDLCLAEQTAVQLGGNAVAICCDVSDSAQVAAATQATLAAFGRIDILVNNAGITRDAQFQNMTEKQWNDVLRINLDGPYHCCKHVVPLMREQGYGRIVNISSSSANGNFGQANYAASKAAIMGMTRVQAKELGKYGINVNAIAPGSIMTDMYAAVPEEVKQAKLAKIPLRRYGDPRETAQLYAFLASDEASYVTAQTITIDGGFN